MGSRGLSALLFGIVFLSSPYLLSQIPMSFSFPLLARAAIMLNGLFIGISGLIVGGADSYQFLLDLYTVICAALMLTGPVSNYPLGMQFWMTMAFVTGIFLGLPTVMLLHLSSKES